MASITLEEELAIVKRAIALRQTGQIVSLACERFSYNAPTIYSADGKLMNAHGLRRLVRRLETPRAADPMNEPVGRDRDRGGRDTQPGWRTRRRQYLAAKGGRS